VTRFFFWNFNAKSKIEHPGSIVARTALKNDTDLLMLTESKVNPTSVLEELNREEPTFHYPEIQHERFAIFTRFPGAFLEPFEDHSRMSVRRLRLPGRIEILVAIVHFPDRRNHTPSEQRSLCFEMAQFLRDAEDRAAHRRTILVGDFNMNRFDEGTVDVNGFGAMMTRD
jgi:exonuclease III